MAPTLTRIRWISRLVRGILSPRKATCQEIAERLRSSVNGELDTL
jgi:hypothetical protein